MLRAPRQVLRRILRSSAVPSPDLFALRRPDINRVRLVFRSSRFEQFLQIVRFLPDRFGSLQLGKSLDGLSSLLLNAAQLVKALEVQPEFRASAKEMGQAQGRVPGDGALAV